MIRALVLLAVLLPGTAHALSCVRPNAAVAFDRMMTQNQGGRVAIGTLHQRSADEADQSGPRTLQFSFIGRILGARGWREIADMPVTGDVTCVGPWCGTAPGTEPGLFLFEETGGGHMLHLHPCNEHRYALPTKAQTTALERCVQNRACALADYAAFEQH